GSVAFADDGAGPSPCIGIRRGWRENQVVTAAISQICGEVVTQAVIESQLAGGLPGVLRESRERMRSHVVTHRDRQISIVNGSQKKARVWIADVAAHEVHSIQGWDSGFIRRETEPPVGVRFLEYLIAVHHRFAAELEDMVVVDPSQAGVGGGFAIDQMDLVAGPHTRCHAAAIPAESKKHKKQHQINSNQSKLLRRIETIAMVVDSG